MGGNAMVESGAYYKWSEGRVCVGGERAWRPCMGRYSLLILPAFRSAEICASACRRGAESAPGLRPLPSHR